MNKQSGWSLVELLCVVVLVGLLAAVCSPYYYDYRTSTRLASIKGLAGQLMSAVSMAQGQYLITGVSPIITLTGQTIVVNTTTGIPVSLVTGIPNTVTMLGYAYTPGPTTGQFDLVPAVVNCFVTYTALTGVSSVTTSGC